MPGYVLRDQPLSSHVHAARGHLDKDCLELRAATHGVATGEAKLGLSTAVRARAYEPPEKRGSWRDDIPRTTSRTEVGSAKASRMNSCGIFGSATFSMLKIQIPPGERGEPRGWGSCVGQQGRTRRRG